MQEKWAHACDKGMYAKVKANNSVGMLTQLACFPSQAANTYTTRTPALFNIIFQNLSPPLKAS